MTGGARSKSHRAQPDPAKSDSPRRRWRWLIVLGALALAALAAEIGWFSDPVQDWWTGRQSLVELERMAATQPGSTRVRYHLARKLLDEHRNPEALAHSAFAVKLDPALARNHELAGIAAYRSGRKADAHEYLTRARSLGDVSAEASEVLASLLMEQDDVGEALTLLGETVRRFPNRAESHYALGRCRARLLMLEGWTQAMQAAVRLAPDQPRYSSGLAEAWLYRNRPVEALAAADTALRADPAHAEALLLRARAMGDISRVGDAVTSAEADAAYRKALQASTDGGHRGKAEREYGRFLLAAGRPREAVTVLERARRLIPEDHAAVYALAQAYGRAGEPARAAALTRAFAEASGRLRDLRYLESRVVADPSNAALRLRLAHALVRAGRAAEAAEHRRILAAGASAE